MAAVGRGKGKREKVWLRGPGKVMADCWLLNIEECISNGKIEDIWTRCKHHEIKKGLCAHKAVQEPSSQRVWIIGGSNIIDPFPLFHHDHIRELSFVAPPLNALK